MKIARIAAAVASLMIAGAALAEQPAGAAHELSAGNTSPAGSAEDQRQLLNKQQTLRAAQRQFESPTQPRLGLTPMDGPAPGGGVTVGGWNAKPQRAGESLPKVTPTAKPHLAPAAPRVNPPAAGGELTRKGPKSLPNAGAAAPHSSVRGLTINQLRW